jgi:phosphoglycolate phosphatase-like HAD superfamily hydrolase
MTDQLIIKKLLTEQGLSEDAVVSKIKECMDEMVKSFDRAVAGSTLEPMDGVVELMDELTKKENIIVGLLTGNLEPIAMIKMKKTGLDKYFKFGGFGTDAEKRSDIIKEAIKKAEKNFDFKFDNNVYLVGDTPRDIKAGIETGVKTIGVATGIYPKEQLEEADFVLEDLTDTDRFLEIISS